MAPMSVSGATVHKLGEVADNAAVTPGGRWGIVGSRSVLSTKWIYDSQIYTVHGSGALLPSGGFECCER